MRSARAVVTMCAFGVSLGVAGMVAAVPHSTPPVGPVGGHAEPAIEPGGGSNPVPRGGANTLVNWENAHVHAMTMTPDGSRLLAVNTPDNRLEVFTLTPGGPVHAGSAPVGLDPVSVRARTNNEAWVVNHISDSLCIVDLTTMNVVSTIRTLDEPADVVFAGSPQRAFVSCSQANTVQVFDPANLAAAPLNIAIEGEDPRELAVSPDGLTVYVAIFESGNRSTVLGGALPAGGGTIAFPPNVVDDNNGPYGPNPGGVFNPNVLGPNPPPNSGTGFMPPINPVNIPLTIGASMIVKKNAQDQWMDDNSGNWTGLVSGPLAAQSGRVVGWDLVDQDVAAINTAGLGVSYATGLMNICMSLSVNPATGRITVVGTEGTNEVRFEPNVNGKFIRVLFSSVDPANLASHTTTDLNPHLTYTSSAIPQVDRDRSLGDPRAIAWNAAGTRGYVTGMGSNNVIVVDGAGARAGLTDTIEVGEGPTAATLDEPRTRLYVLNKFEASISVINTVTETEIDRVPLFDPSPVAIKLGRKHLYDTHKNSGLGQIACASCHVDSRHDRLAWDLGDPAGVLDSVAGQNLGQGLPGLNTGFQPFHPMKGPMTTQSLQGIVGTEPFHWRGDRDGLENFNGAFIGLQGDDTNLTVPEMQEYEDFLATITYPPNPFRNFDNSLPTALTIPANIPRPGRFGGGGLAFATPGNAVAGRDLYRNTTRRLDGGALACVTCHTLPTGAGTDHTLVGLTYQPFPIGPMGEHHLSLVSVDGTTNISTKTPQLRNLYEKTGFNAYSTRNTAGFGVLKDGSVDTIARFVAEPAFNPVSDQEVANLVAFLLAFSGSDLPAGSVSNPLDPPGVASKDSRAAVGWQTTVVNGAAVPPAQATLIGDMIAQANLNRSGLVVKGRRAGELRGWVYIGSSTFQADYQSETTTDAALLASAAPGSELTYTVVPFGSQDRIGVDRDSDGWYDLSEVTVCADPANAASFPGGPGNADVNADLVINSQDFFDFLAGFFAGTQDFNGDGVSNSQDYFDFLAVFFVGCP